LRTITMKVQVAANWTGLEAPAGNNEQAKS